MNEQSGQVQVDLELAKPGDVCHLRDGSEELFDGPNTFGPYRESHPYRVGSHAMRRDGRFAIDNTTHPRDVFRVTRGPDQITPAPLAVMKENAPFPNAFAESYVDDSRYRTGENPQVGDTVRGHGNPIKNSDIDRRSTEGEHVVTGINCHGLPYVGGAPWHAARFDLVHRAGEEPAAQPAATGEGEKTDIGQTLIERLEDFGNAREAACNCERCWDEAHKDDTFPQSIMHLCPTCGNKRCPKATFHGNACTGSNEPGQKGSSWENVKSIAETPRVPPQGNDEPPRVTGPARRVEHLVRLLSEAVEAMESPIVPPYEVGDDDWLWLTLASAAVQNKCVKCSAACDDEGDCINPECCFGRSKLAQVNAGKDG